MKKPTIVALKETEEKLIEVINTCGVPAFVLNQLQMLEQQELNRETANYKKAVEEEKQKKESDK